MDIILISQNNLLTMGDSKKEKANGKAKSTGNDSNLETEQDVPAMFKKVISKLEDLSLKVDTNSKTCEDNFKSSDFIQGGISDKLEKFVSDFAKINDELKEVNRENIALRETVRSLSSKVIDFDKRFELLERQRKKANISIEGVLEIENLPLEKLLDDLLEDLDLKCKAKDVCNKIYRKGKYVTPTAGNMPKPRPVIVQFYDESFKYEIYKNIKKIVGNEKWNNIFINDELTADQTEKMKNMRSINGYAKSVGMDTKIKGTSLIVEGKKYNLDELDCVPEKITITKAKNIETNGSIIFQGHHSFMSNMAKSEIVYEGIQFNSAETAFQYKKAKLCNKNEEAKLIQRMDDPYMVKRACKNIKETNEWKQKKEKVMRDVLEAKFKQNEELKNKLIKTGNLKLVEGTTDKVWGSGVPIAKYQTLDTKNMPGKNLLGQMLGEIRKKISKK